jgi:hypothetical protein
LPVRWLLKWGTAMKTNETPRYDASVNTTGCCPKFNPEGWDSQELHFKDKRFVKATTHSVMHIPMHEHGQRIRAR